jgi:hypothetical protein
MTDSGLILFPDHLLATVPPLYSTEQTPAERKAAHIKVFDPCGRGTWYACEFGVEDGLFFGYVVSPLGPDCDEWGAYRIRGADFASPRAPNGSRSGPAEPDPSLRAVVRAKPGRDVPCDHRHQLELERVTNRLGLRLERDVWWKPGPIPELQPDSAEAAR